MWPDTKSRNSGDYELWNHDMRGSPVVFKVIKSHVGWYLGSLILAERLDLCLLELNCLAQV